MADSPQVQDKGLKAGVLGFRDALAIGLDSTAPAYSLAAVIGIIVATAGLQAPAILLLAFVPMFLTSLAYAAMNRVDPDCGTTFAWVTTALGPFAGWWSGWLVTVTGVLVIGSLADVAALYTYLLVGWDAAAESRGAVAGLAVAYIALACLISVVGTEASGRLQQGMVTLQIGTLLIFAVVTIVRAGGGDAPDTAVDFSLGWLNPLSVETSAIAAGLVTAVFIYWGWESAVAINEETDEPGSVPSRAAVLSTAILLGTYLLVAVAVQMWLGTTTGDKFADDVSIFNAIAGDSLGSPLDKLVVLAVLTSALAATQTTILPASRTTLSMGAKGAFPALFAKVHPTYRTPWLGTIVIAVLAVAWYVPLKFASENFLFDTISALGLLIALYYAATGLASAVYFRRMLRTGGRVAFTHVIGPLIGALILIGVFIKAVADFSDPANSYSGSWFGVGPPLVIGGAFIVLGVLGAIAWRLGPNRAFFDRPVRATDEFHPARRSVVPMHTIEKEIQVDATIHSGGPAVEATGLVKHYSGRSGVVEAVRGIDLRVEAGEIFGFLGPNGAGKSTTIRMLTTLLSITAGTVRVAGVDVAREPDAARRRMGVALQEAGLDPRQTGRELLVLQGRLFGLSGPAASARAAELLALVDLEEAADRRIKGYSGGMKRRLDLASALVHRPEVLFLDEPTTGLDPASRLTVWEEVRRIRALGTTVFLTTQYLEEADQLCDRLAIIDDGLIVLEGTPGRLKAELRERTGLDADPTLDDVFLAATGRTRGRAAGDVQEVSS